MFVSATLPLLTLSFSVFFVSFASFVSNAASPRYRPSPVDRQHDSRDVVRSLQKKPHRSCDIAGFARAAERDPPDQLLSLIGRHAVREEDGSGSDRVDLNRRRKCFGQAAGQ